MYKCFVAHMDVHRSPLLSERVVRQSLTNSASSTCDCEPGPHSRWICPAVHIACFHLMNSVFALSQYTVLYISKQTCTTTYHMRSLLLVRQRRFVHRTPRKSQCEDTQQIVPLPTKCGSRHPSVQFITTLVYSTHESLQYSSRPSRTVSVCTLLCESSTSLSYN